MFNALYLQTRCIYLSDHTEKQLADHAASEREFITSVADSGFAGSVVSTIKSALRVSRVVRDRLSRDTWRVLASLDESVDRLSVVDNRESIPQMVSELNHVIVALAGFSGLLMESMTRGVAWRFLDMGRRLERAVGLATLLRATAVSPIEREKVLLDAVLEVADSGMTYRRRYPSSPQIAPVLDLLLTDDTNPRGLVFQLRILREHIAVLPSLAKQGLLSTQQRLILSTINEVELSDIDELCTVSGSPPQREGLLELLELLGTNLPLLSDSLTETYLYHANVARHLRQREGASTTSKAPGPIR
jgi:uncharacterized alpha-E superfamily protein